MNKDLLPMETICHNAINGINRLIDTLVESAIIEMHTISQDTGNIEKCQSIAYSTSSTIEKMIINAALIHNKTK